MIAAGVLAGTMKQSRDTTSKPGSPDSATVGNPGMSADGRKLVTASALNFPDLMNGTIAPAFAKERWTSPLMSASAAWLAPLYGTQTSLTPAIDLNSSPD